MKCVIGTTGQFIQDRQQRSPVWAKTHYRLMPHTSILQTDASTLTDAPDVDSGVSITALFSLHADQWASTLTNEPTKYADNHSLDWFDGWLLLLFATHTQTHTQTSKWASTRVRERNVSWVPLLAIMWNNNCKRHCVLGWSPDQRLFTGMTVRN